MLNEGNSRSPFGVAKFLNRLLGMNMKRQGLVFDLFVKTLDDEIRSAKNSGSYDVGIKTMKGQSVTFITKPQSFVFRGLTAPQETVELYAIQQDKGYSTEKIMELYNEVKDADNEDTDSVIDVDSSDQEGQGWFGIRKRKFNIRTGFYVSSICSDFICYCYCSLDSRHNFASFQVDDRDYLTATEKVFFIHNPGNQNDKCLVARPNLGVYTEFKKSLRTKFNERKLGRNPVSVQRAMEIWEREYNLADIPHSEYYQMSCPGRHKESFVVSSDWVFDDASLLCYCSDVSLDLCKFSSLEISCPFSISY